MGLRDWLANLGRRLMGKGGAKSRPNAARPGARGAAAVPKAGPAAASKRRQATKAARRANQAQRRKKH